MYPIHLCVNRRDRGGAGDGSAWSGFLFFCGKNGGGSVEACIKEMACMCHSPCRSLSLSRMRSHRSRRVPFIVTRGGGGASPSPVARWSSGAAGREGVEPEPEPAPEALLLLFSDTRCPPLRRSVCVGWPPRPPCDTSPPAPLAAHPDLGDHAGRSSHVPPLIIAVAGGGGVRAPLSLLPLKNGATTSTRV